MGGRRPQHREGARDVSRHRSARRHDGGMATHKSFSARQRGAAPAGVSRPRSGGPRARVASVGVARRSSYEGPPGLSGTPSMRQVDRHVIDRTLGHLPRDRWLRNPCGDDRPPSTAPTPRIPKLVVTKVRGLARPPCPVTLSAARMEAARSVGHVFELEPSATSRMSPGCGRRRDSPGDAAP